jgi:hypothetical protein
LILIVNTARQDKTSESTISMQRMFSIFIPENVKIPFARPQKHAEHSIQSFALCRFSARPGIFRYLATFVRKLE